MKRENLSPNMKNDQSLQNLQMIIFEQLPVHDTLWSITTGKDGNIYVAVCGEFIGGVALYIVTYDTKLDKVRYVLDVCEAIHEPPENGRPTHSKMHYSLVPCDDGSLYGATHCTGAPIGEHVWRPWNCWQDPHKSFTGFHIFKFNPNTGEFKDFGIHMPGEGSRAMAHFQPRSKLYGISYPRNHIYVYYPKKNLFKDLGRIGDINPQAIFLDKEGNAYTTDDHGYLIKVLVDSDEIVPLHLQIPHGPYSPYGNGWHNVPYDVVPSPDGEAVYGSTWCYDSRLFRYHFKENTIEDLGQPGGIEREPEWIEEKYNHIGGLVFGVDGFLYYAAYLTWKEPIGTYLFRLDPNTKKHEEIGPVMVNGHHSKYIAKATIDYSGRLYFAESLSSPTRIYIFTPEYIKQKKVTLEWPIGRYWG